MDGLVKWFLRIYIPVMILWGAFLLWREAPYILAAIIAIALAIWWSIHRDNQWHIRQGYRVEYLSPGIIRGGEDECGVVYHEGKNSVKFYGEVRRRDSIIFVPSSSTWPDEVSTWAKGRRETILSRIQQEKSFIKIETKPDPPTV